jgi:protocatechuate 3,4-dioxygenase beta subunit
MLPPDRELGRRSFLRTASRASAAGLWLGFWHTPGAFAEELTRTPRQTEGPFYPDHLPLDTDNDLLVINDGTTPGVGAITHLTGRVLNAKGDPIKNALVEIWQCDSNGAYLHSKSGNGDKRDGHFQGFGRFLASRQGEYYFRTIKPVPYPGRTPHIHFAVKVPGQEKFTTQCYIDGHAGNETDGVLRGVKDATSRAALMAKFQPIPDSKTGELAARFDIVLGFTPAG